MEHPETIGVIEGKTIKRVVIDGSSSGYPHYIYFVGDDVTENHVQQVGKVFYHRVVVYIDGRTNIFEGTNFQIQLEK